jgi:hypothetical protein
MQDVDPGGIERRTIVTPGFSPARFTPDRDLTAAGGGPDVGGTGFSERGIAFEGVVIL